MPTALLSNYYGNKMWSAVLAHQSWFLAAHKSSPGVNPTSATEVAGAGYERLSVKITAPGSRNAVCSSAADFLELPACTITHLAVWDSISSGHMLFAVELDDPVVIAANGGLHVSANDLAVLLGAAA